MRKKVLTDRYKKVLTWRRGGVKNSKKVLTYFMDGHILCGMHLCGYMAFQEFLYDMHSVFNIICVP